MRSLKMTACTAAMMAATLAGQQPQAPSGADEVRAHYTKHEVSSARSSATASRSRSR